MHSQFDLAGEAGLGPGPDCPPFAVKDFACRTLLLTGATGFIGTFLLAEALRATDSRLYCLGRAADEAAARRRLQHNLETYRCWQPAYAERIVPRVGDLGQPGFALPPAELEQLAAECDAIVHNGALVNFMRPYSTLKAVNVEATRQIIQLAMRHKAKPVHFISSVAVFFAPRYAREKHLAEGDPPAFDPAMQGGYKQSKWVAEHLLAQARERGLPVNIYRLARVFGDSASGIGENFDDLLVRILKACLELKAYPLLDTSVNLVPADYVARAVIYLARRAENLNRTLHLCNPRSIQWHDLFGAVREAGFALEASSYPAWLEKLQNFSDRHPADKFYKGLLLALKFPNYLLTPKPEFDTRQAAACLRPAGIDCPGVDAGLMRRYLEYFTACGFIHAQAA